MTASKILYVVCSQIDPQKGYHYAHLAYDASESVECLIREIKKSQPVVKILVKQNPASETHGFAVQTG